MTTKTDSKQASRPPTADLTDVALIDALACAAAGAMSVSWWHEEVRAGRAPQPAIRAPRCTRWRLAEVRTFWRKFPERAEADSRAGELVKARATKASVKAREPAAVAKAQATRKARIAARERAAT